MGSNLHDMGSLTHKLTPPQLFLAAGSLITAGEAARASVNFHELKCVALWAALSFPAGNQRRLLCGGWLLRNLANRRAIRAQDAQLLITRQDELCHVRYSAWPGLLLG